MSCDSCNTCYFIFPLARRLCSFCHTSYDFIHIQRLDGYHLESSYFSCFYLACGDFAKSFQANCRGIHLDLDFGFFGYNCHCRSFQYSGYSDYSWSTSLRNKRRGKINFGRNKFDFMTSRQP